MTPTGQDPLPLFPDLLREALSGAFPLGALEALIDRVEGLR